MKFVTKKPPIVQSSQKTLKRTMSFHYALIFISIVSIFTSGRYNIVEGNFNLDQAFQAFGMLVIGAFVAVMVEIFYRITEGDTSRFEKYEGFVDPINTGLLIALLLPITTPVYVLALAVIVGTYAGKLVYGGFGYYIFNPALVGVLFVTISFSGQLLVSGTPLQSLQAVFTGGTFEANLQALLLGEYQEIAIGSTSAIALIVLFFYLLASRVIDIRLSGTYLLTMAVMSLGIGFILWTFDGGITLTYTLVNLLTGLTMFAAVFLLSDSVSTPTSRETKIIFGVTAAVLTMLMRTLSDNAEGVIFAVLFANMITPFINRTVKRSNRAALIKTVIGCAVVVIVVTVMIGFIAQADIIEATQVATVLGGIL